jgi:hypothetical protein
MLHVPQWLRSVIGSMQRLLHARCAAARRLRALPSPRKFCDCDAQWGHSEGLKAWNLALRGYGDAP